MLKCTLAPTGLKVSLCLWMHSNTLELHLYTLPCRGVTRTFGPLVQETMRAPQVARVHSSKSQALSTDLRSLYSGCEALYNPWFSLRHIYFNRCHLNRCNSSHKSHKEIISKSEASCKEFTSRTYVLQEVKPSVMVLQRPPRGGKAGPSRKCDLFYTYSSATVAMFFMVRCNTFLKVYIPLTWREYCKSIHPKCKNNFIMYHNIPHYWVFKYFSWLYTNEADGGIPPAKMLYSENATHCCQNSLIMSFWQKPIIWSTSVKQGLQNTNWVLVKPCWSGQILISIWLQGLHPFK